MQEGGSRLREGGVENESPACLLNRQKDIKNICPASPWLPTMVIQVPTSKKKYFNDYD